MSENDLTVEPGKWMSSINSWTSVNKICSYRRNCPRNGVDIKVTIETKARTPFFLSGPEFTFVFYTGATQSWVDVIITAESSEQMSVTSVNCLDHYNVDESIFKTSDIFNKSVTGISREDSMLVNLNQSERKNPALIRIKILKRSELLKTEPITTVHLNWTSVVSLSMVNSGKLIDLPGSLKSVTLEVLSGIQNNTSNIHINIHWIHDVFSRSSYKFSEKKFCHTDVLAKTDYSYCMNYTSVQKSYLFFWHFAQHLQCYITVRPKYYNNLNRLRMYVFREWRDKGYIIQQSEDGIFNNKCPKQQSEEKLIKSWIEASNMCKSIGGTLPILRNRDEMDEIKALLKLSKEMPSGNDVVNSNGLTNYRSGMDLL